MIYSWGLSSISTYIQAKDAKTIEFHQKCELLDEIKVTHEKMSDELYDKIYRFLQYKLENEKKEFGKRASLLGIQIKSFIKLDFS